MSRLSFHIEDRPNQLLATGHDHTHVIVHRGPMSADYDESWQKLMDYVRRQNMVLAWEGEAPTRKFNPDYSLRVLLYTTPGKRMLANDFGITRSFGRLRSAVLGE